MSLLQAKNLTKGFQIDGKRTELFHDVDLEIQRGEFTSIMGSSGSGKTTLLTLLAALDTPDTGSVVLNNKDLTHLSENQLAEVRQREIGFIFQSFHLIPTLNVEENILFPLKLIQAENTEQKVQNIIEKVNMSDRKHSFPHQLSGGEKQRVAIARALIHDPNILFADEPTGNLDEKNSQDILKLLLSLQKDFETALVVVTHDKNIGSKADTLYTLHNKVLTKNT